MSEGMERVEFRYTCDVCQGDHRIVTDRTTAQWLRESPELRRCLAKTEGNRLKE